MKEFSFEKLIVAKVKKLAVIIYRTKKSFPKKELFGMSRQMRRCSVSFASNIAEEYGRHYTKDQARFTEIA